MVHLWLIYDSTTKMTKNVETTKKNIKMTPIKNHKNDPHQKNHLKKPKRK
jgi:hypothetical protein